ncbi:molybdopterin-dependent oxidoreductase, partial [Salmonella enterica subsp. enterica serovar Kentucky]|nr:molybdopterin-dependent oxidoreductase [Salmonella enterica subsp. enterica serovar Kentucky]
MNMLEKVQSQLEHLSKSERKVADVILAAPGRSIHLSIAMLAQEANVSEPTVNRFCRSMNTRGFPDFKLHLAQSLANGTPYVNRNVDEDDSVEAYTGKIFESAMASLDHVRRMQRQQFGEQKHWMIVTLAAMLGQIGTPGGGFGFSYHFANGG